MLIATLALLFIFRLIELFYRKTYSVSLNDEIIGYTNDKVALQRRINEYIKSGEGDVAFVEIADLPTYESCMLKKDIETNDDEIFNKVISSGTAYSKYYAITENNEEKVYMKSFKDAESAVDQLKEKDSANSDDLAIVEKYGIAKKNEESENKELRILNDDDPVEMSSVDDSVEKIYVKKEEPKPVVTKYSSASTSAYRNIGTQIYEEDSVSTDIGISLIRPTTGTISSRFGYRSRDNHKGLDIAAPQGTAIKAAAGGTVTFAGSGAPYSGYGNIVVVQSTSEVSIRYAHCSEIYVTSGEYVSQGQVIAAVGSTGISTGNHLHFEIRYNGNAVDPQNYVYN